MQQLSKMSFLSRWIFLLGEIRLSALCWHFYDECHLCFLFLRKSPRVNMQGVFVFGEGKGEKQTICIHTHCTACASALFRLSQQTVTLDSHHRTTTTTTTTVLYTQSITAGSTLQNRCSTTTKHHYYNYWWNYCYYWIYRYSTGTTTTTTTNTALRRLMQLLIPTTTATMCYDYCRCDDDSSYFLCYCRRTSATATSAPEGLMLL